MANLETLTLEINGSAESATQGINHLIGSLSALGAALNEQVGSARAFSSALRDIHSSAMTGNGKKSAFSTLSSASTARGIKQTTKAMADFSKEQHNAQMISKYGKMPVIMDAKAMDMGGSGSSASRTKEATASMKEYAKSVKDVSNVTDKAVKNTNELAKAEKEVGKTTSSIRQASHATTGLWKQIGRIAKMMLIRTAIRALMKVAKQGLQNYFQYAKSINSQFAAAVDKLGVGATKAGNQLGAAIGSLLAAVAPVLSAIISLVNAALSALSALFALLGGASTFSQATDGMNAFAKATGGGGGALKELLADFDEFNIIAQEGGGGGGGGGFSGIFKESPIPDWMIEWKPLIEALLAGTLGAVVLPAILNGLRKIVDLFTGGGASNLLTFFRYLFNKDTPNLPDIPDNYYKDFPVQPDYKPFPVQPAYSPFPVMPDYAKGAAEMVAFSAAAVAAAPAMTTIVGALTALGGANLVKNGLTALLTKIANSTMKVKVNRKEFDDFKKEASEWTKDALTKDINIMPVTAMFDIVKANIDLWLKTVSTKTLMIAPITIAYDVTKEKINGWVSTVATKNIMINPIMTYFDIAKASIEAWASKIAYKYIYTWWQAGEFNTGSTIIDRWASTPAYKYIYTLWQAHEFNIGVSIIDAWASATTFKLVKVGFDSTAFTNFWKIADAIDEWANQTLTKVINVVVNQTNGSKPSTPGTAITQGAVGGIGLGAALINSANHSVGYDITHMDIFSGNVEKELNNLGLILKSIGIEFKAEGGFVGGDLFIANEAGPELVGTINGRTAVANQDMIIEGIQKGVSEANETQNSLLRQQNELLRSILEKETTVRFGASAAFGRTAKQSIDMYTGMTGG